MQQRGGERRERGEQANAGRQAVHPVDEVERVGAGDQPGHGDREAPPAVCGEPRHARHVDAGHVGEAGSRDLTEELVPRPQPAEIVEKPDQEDDRRRGDQA